MGINSQFVLSKMNVCSYHQDIIINYIGYYMSFLKSISQFTLLVAFCLAVTSCGGGGGGGGGGGITDGSSSGVTTTAESGTVTLLATDAETDQFSEINLTIVKAELLSNEGSEVLFEGTKTFNLLALADVTEVFSITEVPTGEYDKIRLTLTLIELVFHDDREPVYPKLPGNGKLDINPRGVFRVGPDESLTIEMDFDAEKSLHIVSQGSSGGFAFRPVVFTKKVTGEFDTKLIRQQGIIRELDGVTGTFLLCLPEEGIPEPDEDCLSVDASAGGASIFDATGLPAGLEQLENGVTATVVGRFFESEAVTIASASGTTLRTLEGSVSAFDDDEEGEEFSEDDESEDDVSEDDVSEDDESEDDVSDDDESEDDVSDDDESEDDVSEDDESEDDVSDDDVSDDDESEDDVSEDDVSEDDASEDDASEDDTSEDDVNSGLPMVLVADVIWLGGDFSRTENIACTEVNVDGGGMGYDNAELPLAEDAECSDTALITLVTPGTRIYDEYGSLLKSDAIREGVVNQVDGFVTTEDDAEVIRAAMIMLTLNEDDEDERNQFTGIIGVLEAESLTLLTDGGDRCVLLEDGDTDIFESNDAGGSLVFSEQSVDSLTSGQSADVFGELNDQGCLEADTIIYQAESN
jgi:hypothetical protein